MICTVAGQWGKEMWQPCDLHSGRTVGEADVLVIWSAQWQDSGGRRCGGHLVCTVAGQWGKQRWQPCGLILIHQNQSQNDRTIILEYAK